MTGHTDVLPPGKGTRGRFGEVSVAGRRHVAVIVLFRYFIRLIVLIKTIPKVYNTEISSHTSVHSFLVTYIIRFRHVIIIAVFCCKDANVK